MGGWPLANGWSCKQWAVELVGGGRLGSRGALGLMEAALAALEGDVRGIRPRVAVGQVACILPDFRRGIGFASAQRLAWCRYGYGRWHRRYRYLSK